MKEEENKLQLQLAQQREECKQGGPTNFEA